MSKPIHIAFAVSVVLLLQTGCAVGVHARPVPGPVVVTLPRRPPPPPPPPPMQISPDDAIAIGLGFCQQNGLGCWVDQAQLVRGGNVWKVMFDARGARSHGRVHVDVDAWSGALLRADVKGPVAHYRGHGKSHGPGRGHGRHGRGRG